MKCPDVYTLCDKCNKEFTIKLEDIGDSYYSIWAKCSHCKHKNSRWLRIPKKEEKENH